MNRTPRSAKRAGTRELDEHARAVGMRQRLRGRPPGVEWPDEPQALAIVSGRSTKVAPNTRHQMLQLEDAPLFLRAEETEVLALNKKNTFGDPIPQHELPAGVKALGTRYVYTYKMKDGEEITKARLVAQGNYSKFGLDYSASHAETLNLTTLRMLVGYTAAEGGFHYRATDIRSAFVTAPAERTTYVRPAPGQPDVNEKGEKIVYPLKKALYGTVDACRIFVRFLRKTLHKMGWESCVVDPCLYKKREGANICYCGWYVDDGLLVSNSLEYLEKQFQILTQEIDCTPLEPLHTMLGLKFTHEPESKQMKVGISDYVRQAAKDHLPPKHPTKKVPCTAKLLDLPKLDPKSEKDAKEIAEHQPAYRRIVGKMHWICSTVRVDCALSVSLLSRYLHCGGKDRLSAA